MSITIIFTILKFLKKNWKEILLSIVILGCVLTIAKMSIQLKIKQNHIEKQREQIVVLRDENEFLETEVQGLNEKIEDLKTFNKSFDNVKTLPIYEMTKDVINAYAGFSNSFFQTQKGGTN